VFIYNYAVNSFSWNLHLWQQISGGGREAACGCDSTAEWHWVEEMWQLPQEIGALSECRCWSVYITDRSVYGNAPWNVALYFRFTSDSQNFLQAKQDVFPLAQGSIIETLVQNYVCGNTIDSVVVLTADIYNCHFVS